ncbi:hypothetical protein J4460_04665 [Candidatus Woesearchaeota archaeon]|nr:hypothetical protein [uncultured archaeon]MBS3129940.1 hypothetical protein [Candidatus Woesearchaeota archaeon]HIH38055.1 hypothetical protein [Candidatus Woesearchaeota archaeon]HIH48181.1 hypothetical protein [Candidatus Woesearchaeota archaeon]HIJ04296.1 hypothetical protein [Candidatus Woesearchaeota archaeon]
MAETAVDYWQKSYMFGGPSVLTGLTIGLGWVATTTSAMTTTAFSE